MKGIIFNLAEEVVSDTYGPEAWDDLLEGAGLDGAYTSVGNYPDAHLTGLVGVAAESQGRPAGAIIREIGKSALPRLATRYPHFFEGHTSTRPFLLTLNDVIHAEVRKLYPQADVPVFDFETSDGDSLLLGYHSERKLCALAEGFIMGAAAHYGEQATIDQPECMHRGDDRCLIRCSFTPAEPDGDGQLARG